MNRIRRALTGALSALKLTSMRWGARSSAWLVSLGRTAINYASYVGDGRGNAAVLACLLWAARTFPEAPMRLRRRVGAELEPVDDHPLLTLLRRPNPAYSGVLLWMATLGDWMLGNAYWIKVRSRGGRVVQLWWVPSSMMEPKFPDDGSQYISHYEYAPAGRVQHLELAPSEVVHLRNGFDPNNIRKGLSPLGALVREVFSDDEAANFSASLLRNLGVPGLIISPDDEQGLTNDEATEIKAKARQEFGGDNRGAPMVMLGRTKVDKIAFNPQEMNLRDLRKMPEERITAIFGIPAIVIGLGSGLDRSTYSNMAEAREAAYESMILPTQRILAEELSIQLLPDFEANPDRFVLDFDTSEVRVLQEDQNARVDRLTKQLLAGGIMVDEYRSELGMPPLEGDAGQVLFVPTNVTPTLPDALIPEPAPPPTPPAAGLADLPMLPELVAAGAGVSGNGNGNGHSAEEVPA